MTVIDQFQSAIPEAVGDGLILQRWLLHYFFPGNYPLEECIPLLHDLNVPESYMTVAARGYAAAAGMDFAFAQAMKTLTRIKSPIGLIDNDSALLGLALGLRQDPLPNHLVWWQEQLHHLPVTPAGKLFERFLESIRDPDRNAFHVESLPFQHSVNEDIHPGNKGQSSTESLLMLASGILHPIPQWDKDQLADFLIIQRKQPFPYRNDFLLDMLTIKVEDFAIQQMILSPAERAADKAQQLANIQEALTQWADRRAKQMATLASIVSVLTCILITTLLFVTWPQASELRNLWDTLKWATLWLGGPIAGFTLLLRGFVILLRGRQWNLDLSFLQQRFSRRFIHRWQRRLKLPFTT